MGEPDPTAPDPRDGAPDPADGTDKLGDAGKAALEAERKARRDAEKAKRDLEARLKEYEDRDKSDSEKFAESLAAAEKRAAEAEARALRLQVAADKGLTTAQAKRLVGSTQEELEADAAELLEAFPAGKGATPPPTNRPTTDLKGGSDPSPPLNSTQLEADLKSVLGIA